MCQHFCFHVRGCVASGLLGLGKHLLECIYLYFETQSKAEATLLQGMSLERMYGLHQNTPWHKRPSPQLEMDSERIAVQAHTNDRPK